MKHFFSSRSLDSKSVFSDELDDDSEQQSQHHHQQQQQHQTLSTSPMMPNTPLKSTSQYHHQNVGGNNRLAHRMQPIINEDIFEIKLHQQQQAFANNLTLSEQPSSAHHHHHDQQQQPSTIKKTLRELIEEENSRIIQNNTHIIMENDIEVNQASHSSLQVPKPPFNSMKDIGFAEDMNPRHRRTNEDGHCMIDKFRGKEGEGFFAIYDGHGGRGAVNIVQNSFHNIFENELTVLESKINDGSEHIDVTQAFNNAYSRMDAELKVQEILYNGATSITCYIRYMPKANKRFLYVANCGDARVIVTKKTGEAERLTYDHKASDEGEVKRIKAKNGFVAYNRVNGVLSVTRSFGDHAMKEWVISDPFHSFVDLTVAEHDYLVLACDGVWDVISDQECSNIIHENSHLSCQQLSDFILRKALSLGSTDNISVIIVKL